MHGRTTDCEAFENNSLAFLPRSSQPSSRKPAINTTSKQPCLPQTADLEAAQVSEFAGKEVRRPSDQDGKGRQGGNLTTMNRRITAHDLRRSC